MEDRADTRDKTPGKPTAVKAVSALRHRNYQLFFGGQLISLIGTWMQNIAQGWLILVLTNSPFLLGLITAVQFLPLLLFSLVAGEVADRVPKRPLLILTQTSMMIFALILGLLTMFGVVRYWHVLILAALLGISNAFDTPIRQAFIIEMVGKEDLMNAITLNSSMFNGARVIGPALAGLAMGRLGIPACFLLNAASFLAVIVGLALMRLKNQVSARPANNMMWENIVEGLKYIRHTPIILNSVLSMALLSTFAMNFTVLVPVLARINLHQQAEGYGFLASSMGIGALLGALLLAWISGRSPKRWLLYAGGAGLCFFQLFLAVTRQFALSFLLLFLTGVCMLIFTALTNTTVQLNVKDQLRGRVMGVYTIVFLGVTPIGSLLSGSLAHILGAPATIAIGAAVGLVCLMVMIFRERHQALRSAT
ncbi:MAG: MFS transporter [Thermacetogeniaceae bacterium]